VVTSKFDILWELQRVAGPSFSQQAQFQLVRSDPEHSARTVMPIQQRYWAVAILFAALLSFFFFPLRTAIWFNGILNGMLCLSFVFRTVLCWMSCGHDVGMVISDKEVASLQDTDLPVYTVLVPMYKEPDVLPILAADLAYAGLLLGQILGVTLHATGDISADIIMTAYGGGMCLAAVTPPRKTVALAFQLLALLVGAVPELTTLRAATLLPFNAVHH
jgi:hypothetical protein